MSATNMFVYRVHVLGSLGEDDNLHIRFSPQPRIGEYVRLDKQRYQIISIEYCFKTVKGIKSPVLNEKYFSDAVDNIFPIMTLRPEY